MVTVGVANVALELVAPAVLAKVTFVTVFVSGLEIRVPVSVIVSAAAEEIPETVKSTVAAVPDTVEVAAVAEPAAVSESETIAAEDGAMLSNPKPNADTATSAMRLIDVFVDICFLSLKVDSRAFPESAW